MAKLCTCNSDSYHNFHAKVGKTYCFRCSCYLDSQLIGEPVEQVYKPLEIPKICGMPDQSDLPWPNIPMKLVKQYGWYLSEINGIMFLILPIFRNGKMVFYTGRNLESDDPKYISAPGVKKQVWLSDPQYPTGDLFIAESVADACYLSQLGQSVGLLGTSYNGSLDNWMKSATRIIIAFDGDVVGRTQSLLFARYLRGQLICKRILILPTPIGRDPVDLELKELRKLVDDLN